MAAAHHSTESEFAEASDPFKKYRSMIQEASSLNTSKREARAQAESIEQIYSVIAIALASESGGENDEIRMLRNTISYYRTLMDEIFRKY
jgi:sulfur transfer protein SufE